MKKDNFNKASTATLIDKTVLEDALNNFIHKNDLASAGVKPYISQDEKTFGLNCLEGTVAQVAAMRLCFATGAIVYSRYNTKMELLVIGDVAQISNPSFMNKQEATAKNPSKSIISSAKKLMKKIF